MWPKRFSSRTNKRMMLAVLSWAILPPFAGAQGLAGGFGAPGGGGGLNSLGAGGGGGGGTAAGTSSLGGAGTIGTSSPIGSGNISALNNGGVGLSSLSMGTTGARGGATAGGTTSIPAAADPFSSFYLTPYSTGLIGNVTGANTFGQPIFQQPALPTPVAPTTTATVQTFRPTTATGFTSVGMKRTPSYLTGPGENLPLVRPDPFRLQLELQQVIARSSFLKAKDNIQVQVVDSGVARLTGTVTSAHDRRLAEGLIRLTPGVQNVQNDLQIVSQGTTSQWR